MAISATLFQPAKVSFGNLTVHSQSVPVASSQPRWPNLSFGEVQLALPRNLVIGVIFVLALAVGGAGVYAADRAAFATQDQPAEAVYGGVALDYD